MEVAIRCAHRAHFVEIGINADIWGATIGRTVSCLSTVPLLLDAHHQFVGGELYVGRLQVTVDDRHHR